MSLAWRLWGSFCYAEGRERLPEAKRELWFSAGTRTHTDRHRCIPGPRVSGEFCLHLTAAFLAGSVKGRGHTPAPGYRPGSARAPRRWHLRRWARSRLPAPLLSSRGSPTPPARGARCCGQLASPLAAHPYEDTHPQTASPTERREPTRPRGRTEQTAAGRGGAGGAEPGPPPQQRSPNCD